MGETFKASGLKLGADASITINNELEYYEINSDLSFLIIDNLDFGIGYSITNSNNNLLGLFCNYYFIFDSESEKSDVLGVGLNCFTDIVNTVALVPTIKYYRFITPAIAPYVSVSTLGLFKTFHLSTGLSYHIPNLKKTIFK